MKYKNQNPAGASLSTAAADLNQNEFDFTPTSDEVAKRAYFIYVNQGSLPGHDKQHWLEAEAQLIAECKRIRIHVFATRGKLTFKSPLSRRETRAQDAAGGARNTILNNNIIELNEANFNREVLNATKPVLIEFWAGWSAPCKAMSPMLESVAEDVAVPVKVARVNVERQEKLAKQYGVRAVPTLLIFNQGGLQDQIVGRTTGQAVRARLDRLKCGLRSQIATEI